MDRVYLPFYRSFMVKDQGEQISAPLQLACSTEISSTAQLCTATGCRVLLQLFASAGCAVMHALM